MGEIINYNCEGMCLEKTCDQRYTHFINYKIHGIMCFVPFCEKHYNKILDNMWDEKKGELE